MYQLMRQFMRQPKKPTEGERARVLAFLLAGICSAALGCMAVLHLDRSAILNGLTLYQTWIVAASGLGGVIALFLSGDRMGQSGLMGAARGVTGAIWVTFYGALIGGTLGLPLYGTMFGPFIVCVTLLSTPLLSLLWAFNLFSIHMLLGVYQRERDSVLSLARMSGHDHPDGLSARLHGRFV